MNLEKYSKLLVPALMFIIAAVYQFAGINLAEKGITAETIMAFLVPFLTAVGVWAAPANK